MKSPRHDEALAYARDGIPIFPCRVLGKKPACKNGFQDATTDEDQINAWWEEADYNIGLEPERAGWCVIDVDPSGLEAWEDLVRRYGQPRTLTVRTPRDGRHYYFKGRLPAGVGKKGMFKVEGIDTRGVGSYVLVAPSYVVDADKAIDGPYEFLNAEEIAPLPEWLAELRDAHEQTRANVRVDTPANVTLDTDAAIARATTFLRGTQDAGEGERNNACFAVACQLRDLGLSPDKTFELMVGWNSSKCFPPLDGEELARTVASACTNAQNVPGVDAVGTATEVFGEALKEIAPPTPKLSRFSLIALGDLPARMSPPSWLIPDFIPERGAVQFLGKQKSFKTFLALDLALGIAAGRKTFGFTPAQNSVVYCVGENASTFALQHIPAWRLAHDATEGDFPFFTVPAVPRAVLPSEFTELADAIKAKTERPALVVIDTATRALRGLDENSAKDMGAFSECCDFLRETLGCTVLAVRHMGKDNTRGGRGSNVLEGDFDTLVEVVRPEGSFAVSCHVREQRNAQECEPFYFEARKFGPSLAMFPLEFQQFHDLTAAFDKLSSKAIGQALADAQAYGIEHFVSTHALAHMLLPPEDHTPERLNTCEKELRKIAKTRDIMAYTEKDGKELKWFLPVQENKTPT